MATRPTPKRTRPDITPAIALVDAIAALDYFSFSIVLAAVEHRKRDLERVKLGADELRAFYRPGDQGYIIDVADMTLAGQRTTIERIEGNTLSVTVAGRNIRLASSQFAQLPRGAQQPTIAPTRAPLHAGDAVRTLPGGKYGNLRAVVVSRNKRLSIFTLDNRS
jgi:hypothetical protein